MRSICRQHDRKILILKVIHTNKVLINLTSTTPKSLVPYMAIIQYLFAIMCVIDCHFGNFVKNIEKYMLELIHVFQWIY